MSLPVSVQTAAAPVHGYARAKGDTVAIEDEQRVHSLIFQRRQAKKNHDFAKADELRNTLRSECHVEIFDKTMIWKVVGSLGHVPLPNGQASGRAAETPEAAIITAAKKLRKKLKQL